MPALLGGYELLQRIAVGGMAEVFLARKAGPEGFEKRVALKRILPHLSHQPDFRAMFLEEARLAAGLDHPHIVHVYDFGADGETYFLAMEHVAGEELQSVIQRGAERGDPIAPADAATLLIGACEALHHAHERGIIHRDVTPSNLLVSYDGVVKLADFGIAKCEARGVQTQAGALKGKIPYMSPEQAHARPLDRRTDVFSLGICGWELLSGRRLFQRENELEMLRAVQCGKVPHLSSVRDDLPAGLAALLQRALEPGPEARWPTAQAFGEALGTWLADTGAAPSKARVAEYLARLFGADAAERAKEWAMPAEATAPATPLPAIAGAPLSSGAAAPPPFPPGADAPLPSDAAASLPSLSGVAAPSPSGAEQLPLPLPSSATPLPSGATPLPSSATPLPSSATPLPSSATPLLSSATPLPRAAAGLRLAPWVLPASLHLHLPPLRLPRLRLLVPLAALLLSLSGIVCALRSPASAPATNARGAATATVPTRATTRDRIRTAVEHRGRARAPASATAPQPMPPMSMPPMPMSPMYDRSGQGGSPP